MKTLELSAIAHELNFWKGFVQTKRFLEGWVKNIKTPELRDVVHNYIKNNLKPNGSVLDVGSGVVSILNGTVPKEQLTAVDPLGDLYQIIFDYGKHQIKPPIAIPCEEIGIDFWGAYDIVHISNALDHTQNPFEAYSNLLKAVKPYGYIIIQGFENEAEFEKWQGFHQFNLRLGDQFITVTDKDGNTTTLNENIEQVVHAERIEFEKKAWFIWIAKKR